jgi:hypothetical protein
VIYSAQEAQRSGRVVLGIIRSRAEDPFFIRTENHLRLLKRVNGPLGPETEDTSIGFQNKSITHRR